MNIKKYVIDAVSTLLLYNNRDNVDYALELLDRVDNYAKSKNQ